MAALTVRSGIAQYYFSLDGWHASTMRELGNYVQKYMMETNVGALWHICRSSCNGKQRCTQKSVVQRRDAIPHLSTLLGGEGLPVPTTYFIHINGS